MNIKILEYISPSVSNGCYMSLGYYPKETTRVVFDYLYFPIQGNGHFAALLGATQRYYRLSSYIATNSYVLCYGNQQKMPTGFTIDGQVEVGNFYIKVDGNTVYTADATGPFTSNIYLTLGADKPSGGDTLDNITTKIGRFCIYEGDTIVAEFIPALDENNVAGMYNKTNDTFLYSSSSPWSAGPEMASIYVDGNIEGKKYLKASGGSVSGAVVVSKDLSEMGYSYWKIERVGGTQSAATITIDGQTGLTYYSGSTSGTYDFSIVMPEWDGTGPVSSKGNRTTTFLIAVYKDNSLVSVGNTPMDIAIVQKPPQNGHPFYLGENEVTEVYLGEHKINEAYLGDVLVYSSGPFRGIKLSPEDISFNATSLSSELKIKSSEAWSMTLPSWISASQTSGDSGETIVTLTATTQTASTSGTIVVTTANYSASADVAYYDVEFVNYVYENSGSYQQTHRLDTGIAHTASTMTVQLKYKARGGNSDRMVGYQTGDPGCSSDSNDFRIFGLSNGTFDYLNSRLRIGTINGNGQAYDLTIGDLFVYDNTNENYLVQRTATGVVPSPNCHIYVDMSYIKVKEIIIKDGNSVLYDGKAAKMGNDYGLFDTVGGGFITSSEFTIVGECDAECECIKQGGTWNGSECVYPSANKTLTITNVAIAGSSLSSYECNVENNGVGYITYVSNYNDALDEAENYINVSTGYTYSFDDSLGVITLTGPFDLSGGYDVTCNGVEGGPCNQIGNTIPVTFTGNTATVQADWTYTTDAECECSIMGGTWNGSECVYEEDPCVSDPCLCDPNPDECNCMQNGGTWNDGECIYE